MTTTLLIDDALKAESDAVLEDMGLNLTCAITIFLRELTRRRAMPFPVRASGAESTLYGRYARKQRLNGLETAERGCRAKQLFAEMRQMSDREWTLDEINAEIASARLERG